MAELEALDYSSEETEEEQRVIALPMDRVMVSSTHSDILGLKRPCQYRETLRRDYLAHFHVNQPTDKVKLRQDKRRTFIIDDAPPTRDAANMENTFTIDNGRGDRLANDKRKTFIVDDPSVDKRRTFVVDSDTNSTTNGSSPRNSSIFSHGKGSLTTGTSDTEGESGTESAPVVMRGSAGRRDSGQSVKRHSGDFSARRAVQPRYLDASRRRGGATSDATGGAGGGARRDERARSVGKGSARHHEMEQKKVELEKWKRRASYDPRKSAALANTAKTPAKTASSVLRSQSFHGPVLLNANRYTTSARHIPETYDDYTSDNDF